ncbi:glyoxal oxidase N-terminus-domain-containing protein [Mycena crocata]|nr:glyoxal oxidase N-terminus-domain-containing protein [Mycena crocata]
MVARLSLSFGTLFLSLLSLASVDAYSNDSIPSSSPPSSIAPRASVVLPSGWVSRGCVREPSSGRTLTGYSFSSPSMTVTSCVAECNSRNFKYAGIEYANECWCGNTFEGGSAGGGSIAGSAECNMACAGDSTQTCGAGNRLSTYEKKSTVAVAPVLPSGWSYKGCVQEPSSGRTLTNYSFTDPGMTVDKCVATCNSKGFHMAGVEYASECYCGDKFQATASGGGSAAPAGDCSMACAGESTQQCGAGNRLSMYSIVVAVAPVLPTGWTYAGCVQEPSSGRTLANYSFTDPGMTVDKCVATCNSKGFRMAGAEYANECYCGDFFADQSTGGGSAAPVGECAMPCAGEPSQQCGGGNRLSLYSAASNGPTLPTGWAYVACTKELASGRLLNGFTFTSNSLTVESCVATCQSRGFTYAGMQYSSECYCGTGYSSAASVAAESDCSMPCAGKATEKCGAGYRLSVYSSDTTPSASGLVLPPYWSKTPTCITEASTGRALAGTAWIDGGMTVERCVALCDSAGFSLAGLQYKNECYCDNTISTANGGGVATSPNDCNLPCAGNAAEICGAGYRISLYNKTGSTAVPLPAGWSPSMCAVDNNARVLTGYKGTDSALTPASCITKCASLGFILAGVENGGECLCSSRLENNPIGARDVECSTPCKGDASQDCGGAFRIMIYQQIPAAPSGPDAWTLTSGGTSGVVMTHVAVMNSETVLVIDRKENNPLINANKFPAWGAVWSLVSNTARALNMRTHSFCSAGSFLGNGTLVNFGGQPYINRNGEPAPDGQQGIRLFNGCPASGNCDIYENANRVRLGSNRWYPTSARLADGSAIVLGGSLYSGWTNSEVSNNPTYEFYPAKNINGYNGLPVFSNFFNNTLPHNTFPHVYALPDERLFVAANNQAMLLDWRTNTETPLPNFPNGQRVVYPLNAAGVLLPLTPENNYTPEVLVCGGSHISDQIPSEALDAQHDYASAQCSRMVLNAAGISAGWKTEWMPEPRLMSEGTLLPDGKVLIINGCRTGTAGYDNLQNRIGSSNGDHPTLTPLLYDPSAPAGSRFSRAGLPTSNIARMYHSVATLLPSGAIMIGGSNPNDDVSTIPYVSEYRVEYLYPPYMNKTRPTFTGLPKTIAYNAQFVLNINVPAGAQSVYAIVMDFGFVTHSVHMDQKLVKLVSVRQGSQLTVTGPPSAPVYSPGPGWIIVMADGVPSVAQQVIIGSGANPPEDAAAIANLLASTQNPSPGPN